MQANRRPGSRTNRLSRAWLLSSFAWLIATSSLGAQNLTFRDAAGHERRCQQATLPRQLPALESLVDTAALARLVAAAQLEPGVVVSILFNQSGNLMRVRQVEPETPVVTWLAQLPVLIQAQQAAGSMWAVRLRIRSGSDPTAVERSVYCPPELNAKDDGQPVRFQGILEFSPTDRRPRNGERIRLDAQLTLSEQGTVTNVELIKSSGIGQVDQEFVQHFQTVQYLPALVDGLPIPSWVRTTGAKLRL